MLTRPGTETVRTIVLNWRGGGQSIKMMMTCLNRPPLPGSTYMNGKLRLPLGEQNTHTGGMRYVPPSCERKF